MFQRGRDLAYGQEVKIKIDRMLPPFIKMHNMLTDMKSDQDQARRTKHTPPLLERGNQLILGQMNNTIERGNAAKYRVIYGKRAQIALLEGERGIALTRLDIHTARKVEACHLDTERGQKGRNLTGPTAEISHKAKRSHLLGERVEQCPIEWLAGQLVGDMGRVVSSNPIITARKRI